MYIILKIKTTWICERILFIFYLPVSLVLEDVSHIILNIFILLLLSAEQSLGSFFQAPPVSFNLCNCGPKYISTNYSLLQQATLQIHWHQDLGVIHLYNTITMWTLLYIL